MSAIQDKVLRIYTDSKVQAGLSISSDVVAFSRPIGAAIATAFKEVANLSDEIIILNKQ